MKWATNVVSPSQTVLLRVFFGLLPIAVYAYQKKAFDRSHSKHFLHLLIMALVGTIAYYYGFARSASMLQSSVVGGLSGLTPILTFLIALILLNDESTHPVRIAGIAIGFIGVLLIAQPQTNDLLNASAMGTLYAVIGSVGVGASFVYAKKFILPLNIPTSALITYQLTLSLIILAVFTDLDGIQHLTTDYRALAGLVIGLGVLGTGIAYILYYHVVQKMGAVSAASVAYLPPIVAVFIGVFIVGEEIDPLEYCAIALVFIGLLLVNQRSGTPKT